MATLGAMNNGGDNIELGEEVVASVFNFTSMQYAASHTP